MKEKFDIIETMQMNGSYTIQNGCTTVTLYPNMTGRIWIERSQINSSSEDIIYDFKLSNGPTYVRPANLDDEDEKFYEKWGDWKYDPKELAEEITFTYKEYENEYKQNWEVLFNRFLEIYRDMEGK